MNRIKVCANYDLRYDDNVTNLWLLEKIKKLYTFATKQIKYAIFQKSNIYNYYGILLVLNFIDDNIMEIFKYVKNDLTLKVFAYKIENSEDIYYLTENKYIVDRYFENDYKISMSSFIQADLNSANKIHVIVNNNIDKDANIIGLGGLSYIYMNKLNSNNIFLTNSISIYNDSIENGIVNSNLIDYSNLTLKLNDDIKYTLIINISKSGLKNLVYDILNIPNIDKIIYIGCSKKIIDKDHNIIITKYKLISTWSYLTMNYINIYIK